MNNHSIEAKNKAYTDFLYWDALKLETIQCVDVPMGRAKEIERELDRLAHQNGIGACYVCGKVSFNISVTKRNGYEYKICEKLICNQKHNGDL